MLLIPNAKSMCVTGRINPAVHTTCNHVIAHLTLMQLLYVFDLIVNFINLLYVNVLHQ